MLRLVDAVIVETFPGASQVLVLMVWPALDGQFDKSRLVESAIVGCVLLLYVATKMQHMPR